MREGKGRDETEGKEEVARRGGAGSHRRGGGDEAEQRQASSLPWDGRLHKKRDERSSSWLPADRKREIRRDAREGETGGERDGEEERGRRSSGWLLVRSPAWRLAGTRGSGRAPARERIEEACKEATGEVELDRGEFWLAEHADRGGEEWRLRDGDGMVDGIGEILRGKRGG